MNENIFTPRGDNKVNFGEFYNVEYTKNSDNVTLDVNSSANFSNEVEKLGKAKYGEDWNDFTEDDDEPIEIENEVVEGLAGKMSKYLTQRGIDNEIVDIQMGYGQVSTLLGIEISTEDFENNI